MKENSRDVSLDFLRGLAVIFMIMQHLSVWLWDAGWSKSMSLFAQSPVYLSLIAFSALSAPVFVFCAGVGAYLFMQQYKSDAKIIRRGVILLVLGYVTVVTIGAWFSWASWYVLQLIGFCFISVPFLKKLKRRDQLLLFAFVALTAIVGQFMLQTPLAYGNSRMSDLSLALAPIRLAFFEGHFPIFPWWGVFIIGYYFGGDIQEGTYSKLLITALCIGIGGLLLILLGYLFPSQLYRGVGDYIFSYRVRFYPLLFPILLLLVSASLFSVYAAHCFCQKFQVTQKNPVTAIGRISLTAFVTHIYIKEVVYGFDLVQTLSKWQTIGVTIALLAAYAFLSLFLRKYAYRFTLEWVFRKLG